MDIQKEREAFENHLKKMGKTDNETFSKNEDDSYQMDIIHFGWKIWQAATSRMEVRINTLDEMLLNQGEALAQAKAQAVPEGLVLMPRICTNKMAHAAKAIDGRLSAFKYADVYKAMIEAQEPANDSR